MRIFKHVLLVSVVSISTGAALAQSPLDQGPGLFPAPAAQNVSPSGEGQQPARSTPPAAPMPLQPVGGFGAVPPSPTAQDPANRMTLTGGEAYLDTLVELADQRLGALSPATPSSQTELVLERMMAARLNNMFLEIKQEEAELAVGLVGVLYNNEHAQAWRQREIEEASARAEAEEAASAARLAAMQQASLTSPDDPLLPVVYSVTGGTAILLVPGSGEVYVRAGTTLPDDTRVVSVSAGSVVVARGDRQYTLGFGTAVGGASGTR